MHFFEIYIQIEYEKLFEMNLTSFQTFIVMKRMN
jgi:hypothetical protein